MSDDTPERPVISIGAARLSRADKPEHVDPRDALVAALEYYDNLERENRPTHIMVLIGHDVQENRGASETKFYQAGLYRHHAQMGLCLEAMHMIRESG